MLTTEPEGNPDCLDVSHKFPGSITREAFVVRNATKTVLMGVELKLFADTISAGLRYPGSDPLGSPASLHQISPRFIVQLHTLHRSSRNTL